MRRRYVLIHNALCNIFYSMIKRRIFNKRHAPEALIALLVLTPFEQ